jgi:hypothetical protein
MRWCQKRRQWLSVPTVKRTQLLLHAPPHPQHAKSGIPTPPAHVLPEGWLMPGVVGHSLLFPLRLIVPLAVRPAVLTLSGLLPAWIAAAAKEGLHSTAAAAGCC